MVQGKTTKQRRITVLVGNASLNQIYDCSHRNSIPVYDAGLSNITAYLLKYQTGYFVFNDWHEFLDVKDELKQWALTGHLVICHFIFSPGLNVLKDHLLTTIKCNYSL